jgi:dienelactone hydrolase
MKNKRRQFLKQTALAGLGIAGSKWLNASGFDPSNFISSNTNMNDTNFDVTHPSVIGLYGPWAASLNDKNLPSFSFRRKEFGNIEDWRKLARKRVIERMSIPNIGGMPKVMVNKQYNYDGLHIEELTWQLSYGRATEAILLKPENARGRLPAILAFHDHGGNKYFGTRKITKTSDQQHPSIVEHQKEYYEGMAWANEIAKRGYVVLVNDAFPFASRRVMMQDVPEELRHGLNDNDPEDPANIDKYNQWAGQHEHIMAKSLFCAGTTWPAVFFIEDQKALDILCARDDVDAARVGCGGLSGGGMRTVFMGGLDPRIKCAIPVGFMTTWKDFLLYKTFNHTWMIYVPLLPNELDFPEILGLRAPLPSMVLCDEQDDLYTMEGMNDAEKILKQVYAKARAENSFKCSYYPGPHKFDKKMQADAFDWFDKWLKK